MTQFIASLPSWLQPIASVVVAILLALVAHQILMLVLRRAQHRVPLLEGAQTARHLSAPLRWLMIAFALSAVQPALGLPPLGAAAWRLIAGLLVPALLGWLVLSVVGIGFAVFNETTDVSGADNLSARRRRTRASILHRVVVFVVLLATFCLMLISIPAVRSIGVTLIASAGLAGLALGAAAQPALKNLISGLQMAFTEPIRIDDVVIVDGEWGRIEDIRLTYVVVKIWDDRRLVVPVSRFLEDSFQNWTRQTSQLLGTAFLHVDPATDVPRLRERLEKIVRADPNWDGRVIGLQVTDTAPTHLEVRALVSAADAGKAFDLRCNVREAMMAFIRTEMPEAIVRTRQDLDFSKLPANSVPPKSAPAGHAISN